MIDRLEAELSAATREDYLSVMQYVQPGAEAPFYALARAGLCPA